MTRLSLTTQGIGVALHLRVLETTEWPLELRDDLICWIPQSIEEHR